VGRPTRRRGKPVAVARGRPDGSWIRPQRRGVRPVGSGGFTALLTVPDSSPGTCQLTPAAGRGSSCWPTAARRTAPRRAATASVQGLAGASRPLLRQRPRGPTPSGPVWPPGPARSEPRRGRSRIRHRVACWRSVRHGRRTGAPSRARSQQAGQAGQRWAGSPPQRQRRPAPLRRPRRRVPGAAASRRHQHVGAATATAAAAAGTKLTTAVASTLDCGIVPTASRMPAGS
jgi:hypothetical protein